MTLFPLIGEGLLIGFAIAAPVGPIGVLCIRRTFADGPVTGFATGMGAATADGIYGAVAAFGLTAISDLLIAQEYYIRLIGGAFLLWLAFSAFRSEPDLSGNGRSEAKAIAVAYSSTVFLTLANPSTILSFLAIFGGMGLVSDLQGIGPTAAIAVVIAVFTGSALWWVFLAFGSHRIFGGKIGARQMRWINRGSGALLGSFGIYSILGALI